MPRTKQTAAKSTGEPAPRKPIGATLPNLPPPAADKKRKSSTRTRVDRRKSTKTAPSTDAQSCPVFPTDMSLDLIQSQPSSTIYDTSTNFCSICRNGGVMQACDYCPRSVCIACVPLPNDMPFDAQFKCVYCFSHSENGVRKAPVPYLGLSCSDIPISVAATFSQREFMPLCSAEPLMIVTIKLASIPTPGLPPNLVFEHLSTYLPGNINHVVIPFDLSTSGGVDAYTATVDRLVHSLEHGEMIRFRRFLVFLIDHSDPERGDLHFATNNQGASSVSDLFAVLFPSNLLRVWTAGISQNILTLLACGGILKHEKSMLEIKAWAKSGPFQSIIAFGQLDFQPSVANVFLMDVMLHWFIYHRSITAGILSNHQVIGSHTDIYFFCHDGKISRLIWSHPGLRPFGNPLDLQCQCKALKPWSPTVTLSSAKDDLQLVRLSCKYCGHTMEYEKPKNIRRLAGGKYVRSEGGDWYKEHM